MAEDTPRIPNLPREEWTPEAREVFAYWMEPDAYENGSKANTIMVMAQHPKLGMAYSGFGRYLLLDSTLPVWPRELVTLRISWHLKAEYEWHYHVGYAVAAGMTFEQIAAIVDGPDAPGWSEADRAVLQATDDLWRDQRIGDETWPVLIRHFDKRQLMDLVFTAANYVMFTWAINSFDIPIETDDPIGFDLKRKSGKTPERTYRPGETENWTDHRGH